VYNGVLNSELTWSELRQVERSVAPTWTLAMGDRSPLPPGAHSLGAHRYAGDVEVRLWAADDLWRVRTSDVGDFDITDGGHTITWRPSPALPRNEELARFDILGRVLPLALHRGGALSLHGSAVATADGAILMLGPKGRGKSTLAVALAQSGAPLLTDDVAVVEHRDGVSMVRPGVHSVRLWPDSASQLGTDAYGPTGSVGRKLLIHSLPDALLAMEPAPISAVYLLEPTEGGDVEDEVAREHLSSVDAARRLLGQATAGNLLGGAAAAQLLERTAEMVRRAPTYVLRIPRSMTKLPQVVDQLLGWHGDAIVRAPSRYTRTSS